jgi:hypothetical protein
LNSSGSALVYSTYLGGINEEGYFFHQTGDIAVDAAGHAVVTGYTHSSNFPVYNAIQPTRNGNGDAYVTKLTPEGSAFVFSTYLGGNVGERGRGVTADANGNVYVAGTTSSEDFPTTPNSFQPEKEGGLDSDSFISKFKSDGSAFLYSTYLGGTDSDSVYSIAVDNAGNAYLSGSTQSLDFPIRNAFQPVFGGGDQDAFATKLSAAGNALVYSSYLGGGTDGTNGILDGADGGSGIAIDQFSNAYVTGLTYSSTFPIKAPFQDQIAAYADAFVTKVSRFWRAPLQKERL